MKLTRLGKPSVKSTMPVPDDYYDGVPEPADYKPEVYFDLDGTLAVNGWPDHIPIGDPIPKSIELLRYYHDQGYVISIFTVRPSDHKANIWDWLRLHDLAHLIYRVICDKPYYGLLIDDRSWNPPWLTTPQSK